MKKIYIILSLMTGSLYYSHIHTMCIESRADNLARYAEMAPLNKLNEACKIGDIATVKDILSNQRELNIDLNSSDLDVINPLVNAVNLGRKEIVAALLEAGANPNTKDYLDQPVIALAVKNEDKDMLALLLKSGAKPDLQISKPGMAVLIATLPRRMQELPQDTTRLRSELWHQDKMRRAVLKSMIVPVFTLGAIAQLSYCKSRSVSEDSIMCSNSAYLGTFAAGIIVNTVVMTKDFFNKK